MKIPEPSAAEGRAVRMLRALANPVRFRIVVLLAEQKDATSPGLVAELGIAQSSLFDHLAALREAGVVQVSQPGQSGRLEAQSQANGEGPPGLARTYCLDPGALDFLSAFLSGLGERARSWEGLVVKARREDGVEIREATLEDAASIAHVYNQGIEDRVATLETALRSAEERTAWLGARTARHPVVVATRGEGGAASGTVLGWASLESVQPPPRLRPCRRHLGLCRPGAPRPGHRRRAPRRTGGQSPLAWLSQDGSGGLPLQRSWDAPLRAPRLSHRRDLPRAGDARWPLGRRDRNGEDAGVDARWET